MKKIDLLFILLLIGCQEAASLKEESLLIIAHRGASGYAPESTLASFRLANKMNADYLEFDVQMTKDGELVVFHDAKVDRTTNAKGELKQYTLKQLKELDAGSWFNEKYQGEKVLTVREVFEAFGNRTNYFIEIKNPPNDSKIEEN